MRRQTLKSSVRCAGVGVHSGEPCAVVIGPANFGVGRVFCLEDGTRIPAKIEAVRSSPGRTVLASGDRNVQTPEHLLAALVGLGITDATLQITGPEVPILDGSALPWCAAITGAGLAPGPALTPLTLPETVRVETAGGWAVAMPSPRRLLAVYVDFDDPALPRGTAQIDLEHADFVAEIAPARTFVLERDVPRALAAGLGRGASAENTVVWGSAGSSVASRLPDEAVRHKLLDLMGDLALLGHPIAAQIEVHRGSHRLHHALIRALAQAVNSPA